VPNPWSTKPLALLLLACLVVGAGTSILVKSATWDETHYFGVGRALISSGEWDFPGSVLHPPLAFYLSSLPLWFFDLDQSGFEHRRGDPMSLAAADIERGQALLSDPANRNDRLLNLSRFAMIPLALLLGACVFAWSRDLHGPAAGLLSLLFFCFSPNILAHARLITPDMALTTFSFATLYALWKSLALESPRWSAAAGASLGLALLSKYTALLILPACGVLIWLWKLKRGGPSPRWLLLPLAIATGIFFLGYGFDIGPYFAGIEFQLQHAGEGHRSFLLGQRSSSGWWYYFPVAFALKTPLPTLLLLAASLVLAASRARSSRWLDEAFLLLPICVFFAFFCLKHQSIGLRYILPVYPFAFVFLARAFTASSGSGGRARIVLVSSLVAWYVVSSVYIHPHYLAYFNELAGGPSRGYRSLVDSNLDWGQDLKGLKQYMQERGIERVSLSYFGSDTPTRYGIDYDWLPSLYLRNPSPDLRPLFPPDGWIAISATNLQGVYLDDPDLFAFLREREPATQIGYSIFVYPPYTPEKRDSRR
jgi:4-amino-4-deoxy-L-arabinose transferase-like glycosyltransferase